MGASPFISSAQSDVLVLKAALRLQANLRTISSLIDVNPGTFLSSFSKFPCSIRIRGKLNAVRADLSVACEYCFPPPLIATTWYQGRLQSLRVASSLTYLVIRVVIRRLSMDKQERYEHEQDRRVNEPTVNFGGSYLYLSTEDFSLWKPKFDLKCVQWSMVWSWMTMNLCYITHCWPLPTYEALVAQLVRASY